MWFKGSKAGCDMLLMPVNEEQDLADVLVEMEANEDFLKNRYILQLKK